jgi:hypothetical protein
MKGSILMLFAIGLFLTSCNKIEKDFEKQLQGEWELVSTSGGFTGAGISTEWDVVIFEDDTFDLITVEGTETESYASGKITLTGDIMEDDLYNFDFDFVTVDDFGLDVDPEKIIEINQDSMDWISPCCDRINYHFIKK